jgi:diguanylate cyclase (GGDEF)-like protein
MISRAKAEMRALRALLPEGGSLPLEDWRRRHKGIMVLVWLNVPALSLYAAVGGHSSVVHEIDGSLALCVLAGLGSTSRLSRTLRCVCASLALLVAAALFIHDSGGLIEGHFYFFVIIIVLTLYEDWVPFLLAVGFVFLHHGVLGTLEPHGVFDRPDEWAHPWRWALIHSAFVAAAGIAALVTWRLNEDVRAKMRVAHQQLETASETDSLTGLGNRRRLMIDLEAVIGSGHQAVLVILDLNGFKAYNDTFGHPAGDALLARIGARLQRAVGGDGSAYRLGGDEFCTIWHGEKNNSAAPELTSAASMCEQGEGFAITSAYGAVAIPSEAHTAERALQAADERLYAHKDRSRSSSSVQSKDVLRQTIAELRPELAPHADAVMILAENVALQLDLAPHLVQQVRQAAQLHDIGKIAIPYAVLYKRSPLTDTENGLIRCHPTIGERIINAAPDLAHVAPLVRSSHEHYDGTGYPDGLAGRAIPVGARIIAVCDAFDALTTNTPRNRAVAPPEALEEIIRDTGARFDPEIVAALQEVLAPHSPRTSNASHTDRQATPAAH